MAFDWQPKGQYGMICEPFSIGKYFVLGAFCYRLWRHDRLIAEAKTFEDAAKAAEKHKEFDFKDNVEVRRGPATEGETK